MADYAESLLKDFIVNYIQNVRDGFDERMEKVTPEIYQKQTHECIGGLLSRQATLTIELAQAPSVWNGHVAPLFLRCMVEAYITLAWILDDPVERSEMYVKYGLGQEKLSIEYMEQALEEGSSAVDADYIRENIRIRKAWLNSQLAEWAVDVDVGSWSGISTREMAKEIGRESIYRYAYVPFSGPAHNMWQHIGRYNLVPCHNPLHKWHLVPKVHEFPVDPDFMYRSAKYVSLSYQVFDEKQGIVCDVMLPDVFLTEHPLFSESVEEREGDPE